MTDNDTARLLRKIIETGHDVAITPKIKDEIEEHGVPSSISDKLKVVTEVGDRVLVCMEIKLGAMLILPDNKTAPCAWGCGRTVQYRPWIPDGTVTVCIPCAAERGLHDQ